MVGDIVNAHPSWNDLDEDDYETQLEFLQDVVLVVARFGGQ